MKIYQPLASAFAKFFAGMAFGGGLAHHDIKMTAIGITTGVVVMIASIVQDGLRDAKKQ